MNICKQACFLALSLLLVGLGGSGLGTSSLVFGQRTATVTHIPSGMQFNGGVSDQQRNFLSVGSSASSARLLYIYDGPRKVVVPENQANDTVNVRPPSPVFHLRQEVVPFDRSSIRSVGSTLQRKPFNEFGRRQILVETNKGVIWLLEGITELEPTYARVQGIQMDGESMFEFPFDYRIATTTIPGDLLVQLLRNATDDLNDYNQRLLIVEFLIDAARYRDALRELQRLLNDFPDLPKLDRENVTRLRGRLTTDAARLVLRELEMRRDAGQFQLVAQELKNFDATDVAPETLQLILAQQEDLRNLQLSATVLSRQVSDDFDAYLAAANLEEELNASVAALKEEILADLNPHNVNRLSTYALRSKDVGITSPQKISFLISGWMLGAADAIDNIDISLSMMEVRQLMIKYLNSSNEQERREILDRMAAIEAGAVRYLAAMARNLLPWKPAPAPEAGTAGFFRLSLADIPGQPEFLVQLPPEYDPYKKYPCIVSVCDSGQSPDREIEWWDSTINPASGLRQGNASRHGYITIAPDWRKPLDYDYDYGPYAANVILSSLREASRMFAIDSDRVFLSGHGIGGEVAWDLGLAHPDLWAGVMPISAIADRYIQFYKDNSKYTVPFYFVLGENHIPPARGMLGTLDKREDVFQHMASSRNFNFIVVVYRGRRSEHFYEEILNLFTWMRSQRRRFDLPEKKFRVSTMRPWDNFFWYFEMHDNPRIVLPAAWDLADKKGALPIEGEIKSSSDGKTNLQVGAGGNSATFWLSPKWANLDQEILFNWKGNNERLVVPPSREVIMEDLRRRSDTNNPFWAKATCTSGQWEVNDGR